VDVIVQSARGLAAAHGAGVIHRDVKPSNLMLLPDGTVKVTDFGLAKSLGGEVDASGGGMLLGTPTYMAPEQCRGRPVDARTDIYALGLTAWYLLGGKPPYASESLGQMLQDQMNTPLPSIRDLRPELPPALDRALARLCEKDPSKRPASMDEVAALFEPFRPRPLETATFMARTSAFAIDATMLGLVAGIVGGGAAMLDHWVGVKFVSYEIVAVLVAAALLVQHFATEAWLGTTLGKWLFNLEVVREDGASPSRAALFGRFAIRFPLFFAMAIPKLPDAVVTAIAVLQALAIIGGAISFAVRGRRTISDLVTKTRIVYRSSR
jgi:uncharacterized RDD family membrane protein YckC